MTEQVKWGVLGNANIARVCLIPAIQKSRTGTVHALATRSPERVWPVAAEHNIQQVYNGYEALLEDPDIEAVYIPLPNHLHHPWTLKALNAGKHVLCEKPLACNAHQAEEMAEAAEDHGLLLMEALMYRFHPRSKRIKELVDAGVIGEPVSLRAAFCYRVEEELLADEDNVRMNPDQGGGALLDVGCYCVSVARWLMGTEPTRAQAEAVYHSRGVDTHFLGTLRFPGGRLATVEASFVSALQQTYSIVGSEGAIELPHDAFVPWEKDALFTVRGPEEELGKQQTVAGADEYLLMIEHFNEAILGKASLAFAPRDSVRNMEVLDALAQAAETGRGVIIERRTEEAQP
jgi:xylose dehydrogenase (NAD/NADP)